MGFTQLRRGKKRTASAGDDKLEADEALRLENIARRKRLGRADTFSGGQGGIENRATLGRLSLLGGGSG